MQKQRTNEEIIAVEEAIREKFGNDAVSNPSDSWNEEKEQNFFDQVEKEKERDDKYLEYNEKIEHNGFLISKKLLKKEKRERNCPVCNVFSFNLSDDLYMTRYKCCFKCYIQYVENREERWKTGWRPNNETERK